MQPSYQNNNNPYTWKEGLYIETGSMYYLCSGLNAMQWSFEENMWYFQ